MELMAYDAVMKASDTLRRLVETCGMTCYEVSKRSGVPKSVLSRFMAGRGLSLDNLDKLADTMGWEIVKRKSRK